MFHVCFNRWCISQIFGECSLTIQCSLTTAHINSVVQISCILIIYLLVNLSTEIWYLSGMYQLKEMFKNKMDRMISVPFQGKPFNIMVIQVYALTSNTEEAEVIWFYEDLQDLLELTPPKNVLFIIGDWNAEVGSQETPGVTGKFGLGVQNEAGQRLLEFCQENALVITNTFFQQQKRRLYTWTSPDGQHQTQIVIFCAAKDGEALHNQQKQDQELTVAQIMNSLLPNSD